MRNRPTNTNRSRDAALCGFALGTAIGTSLALTQRGARHPQMPNLKTWRRALIEKHGEVQGAFLAARVQARYEALYNERPHFPHPALRWHLEQLLLPGLALYQALSKESHDRDAVLAETGSLVAIGSMPRAYTKWVRMCKYLPLQFAVIRQLYKIALLAFPQQGWGDIEQIEDSETCFAFNLHRCFYLDVLTAYGAPELTAVFCRIDELAFTALPPAVRWERPKTLGRGDDHCEFRLSRVEPGKDPARLIQVQSGVKKGKTSSSLN